MEEEGTSETIRDPVKAVDKNTFRQRHRKVQCALQCVYIRKEKATNTPYDDLVTIKEIGDKTGFSDKLKIPKTRD